MARRTPGWHPTQGISQSFSPIASDTQYRRGCGGAMLPHSPLSALPTSPSKRGTAGRCGAAFEPRKGGRRVSVARRPIAAQGAVPPQKAHMKAVTDLHVCVCQRHAGGLIRPGRSGCRGMLLRRRRRRWCRGKGGCRCGCRRRRSWRWRWIGRGFRP